MSTEKPSDVTDEMEYHGYLVGRPTKTAEVSAPDGTSTIEEGTLIFKLAHKHDIMEARQDGGWMSNYVGPDGGIGFGLDEGNNGGVVVPYDLVEVIPFPQPMTESEAHEWWDNEQIREWVKSHTDFPAENGGDDDR